jgi:molecular chaperone DnaK
MVDARNQCDAMVHSVKKAMTEHGDKMDADEKAKIEAAIKEAEDAMKDGDKATLEAKTQALGLASQKLGEKIYAESQQAAGGAEAAAGTGGAAGAGAAGSGAKKDESDVVDAEFTEVNDKK